jgi:hypothetical protein
MGARRKRWRHIAAMRGPGLSCRRRAAGVHVSAWTALARLLDGAARQTAARRRRYKTDQLLGLRSKHSSGSTSRENVAGCIADAISTKSINIENKFFVAGQNRNLGILPVQCI